MKVHKKLISIVLALALVISCVSASFVASAADPYKPTYTDKVTEKDVEALIGDLNTILNEKLLTGSTIESMYKFLPSLKSLVMTENSIPSDQGKFYKAVDPERFAELDDGQITADVTDDNGNVTTEGTLTAFFKEHPIVVNSPEEFKTELDKWVKAVMQPNILTTLSALPMMLMGSMTPEDQQNMAAPARLFIGLDDLCKAIGVEQEKSAAVITGTSAIPAAMGVLPDEYKTDDQDGDVDAVNEYIQNITAVIFKDGDVVNNLIDIIQRVLDPEYGKYLYSGLTGIMGNLNVVIKGLEPTLTQFGVDITSVQSTITKVADIVAALPTIGSGDNAYIDLQGAIGVILQQVAGGAIGIQFGDTPASGTVVLKFTEMQLDRVANAQSNADVIKIVYDYLYNNVVGNNQTNSLISMAIETGIIENALGVTLDDNVKGFITKALASSNDELAYDLIVMVADLAGREIVDPSNPNGPSNPNDPSNPSENPSTNPNASEKDKDVEKDDSGRQVVKQTKLPNTSK